MNSVISQNKTLPACLRVALLFLWLAPSFYGCGLAHGMLAQTSQNL